MFVNAELHLLADDATPDYVDSGNDQGYCRCDNYFARNVAVPGVSMLENAYKMLGTLITC